MSGREWKPGDVGCLANGDGDPFAFYTEKGWAWIDGSTSPSAPEYDGSLRPLVVIDLPEGALAGWPVLIDALREAREKTGYRMIFNGLIDQIEAQTAPPRPSEPTGLGAVVEDEDGERWVRVNSQTGTAEWRDTGPRGMFRYWPGIAAVRVLSEGVTP